MTIIDLERDISTSPALVNMLVETDDACLMFNALVGHVWFKLRDVTKDIEDQVIEILSVDRQDKGRMWKCSAWYADEVVSGLRWQHHQIESDRLYRYADRIHDIPRDIIEHFRAIGWEATVKTANDW
jgi:hypothetical protein